MHTQHKGIEGIFSAANAEAEVESIGQEFDQSTDDTQHSVQIPSSRYSLSQEELEQLKHEVPHTQSQDGVGVDIFFKTLLHLESPV